MNRVHVLTSFSTLILLLFIFLIPSTVLAIGIIYPGDWSNYLLGIFEFATLIILIIFVISLVRKRYKFAVIFLVCIFGLALLWVYFFYFHEDSYYNQFASEVSYADCSDSCWDPPTETFTSGECWAQSDQYIRIGGFVSPLSRLLLQHDSNRYLCSD